MSNIYYVKAETPDRVSWVTLRNLVDAKRVAESIRAGGCAVSIERDYGKTLHFQPDKRFSAGPAKMRWTR